ncbi:hypothetical protein ACIBH1_41545 [Nonomuraea sp. NPDC050663]|uniref:hypothetical protein n=1 Tax=Nonomuraea sp. NPDC050663 TaxID=3364370 RepID=UPI003794567C
MKLIENLADRILSAIVREVPAGASECNYQYKCLTTWCKAGYSSIKSIQKAKRLVCYRGNGVVTYSGWKRYGGCGSC